VLDRSHDPRRRSWIESANGHRDFPIQNLPYGVVQNAQRRGPVDSPILNDLLRTDRAVRRELRLQLSDALSIDASEDVRERLRPALISRADTPAARRDRLVHRLPFLL